MDMPPRLHETTEALFKRLLAEASNTNRSPKEEAEVQAQREARADRIAHRATEYLKQSENGQRAVDDGARQARPSRPKPTE